jgi:hypothetical protein
LLPFSVDLGFARVFGFADLIVAMLLGRREAGNG